MKDDLQQLRSLRLAYREGGDLKEIIDGVVTIVKKSTSHSVEVTDGLVKLKAKVDQLAQSFLKGTMDRATYTLEWDQLVRDTMKVIDQLEQEIINQDTC